jgi:hypothetical protein
LTDEIKSRIVTSQKQRDTEFAGKVGVSLRFGCPQ